MNVGGEDYPGLHFRVREDANVTYLVEVVDAGQLWQSGENFTTGYGAPESNGDGTSTLTVRSLDSLASMPNQLMRLRVILEP